MISLNFFKKWMQLQFSEISAILNKFLKLMPVTRAGCWRLVIVSLVTEEMWSNGKISPWLVAGTSLCGSASDSRLAMLVITCTDNTHPHTLGQSYSYNTHFLF